MADRAVSRADVRVAASVRDDEGERVRTQEPVLVASDTMVLSGQEGAALDAPVRAYLLVRGGADGQPAEFDLGGPLISIGRATDNDLILDDPEVSRHHCQLKLQHGAYSFADLGSRNGSLVNGQEVSEIALGPGDVIRIGSTEIEFQVRE